MQWKVKDATLFDGAIRIVKRFAWKPTTLGKRVVWLEFYNVHEKYYKSNFGEGNWRVTHLSYIDKF